MRFLMIVAAAVASLWLGVAQGQMAGGQMFPGPGTVHAAGGGFSGPGDVVSSATAFYSCARAYNAAYANGTNSLCDLNAVTGGAAVCTLRVATSGFADLAASYCAGTTPAAACAAASGGNCVVSKVYDQTVGGNCTGSCDVAQATLANMPALTFSALNGLPCLTMSATSELFSAGPLTVLATQPFSTTMVAKQTTGGTNTDAFPKGNPGTFFPNSTSIGMFAGASLTASITLNTYRGMQFIFNTTSTINVSGTQTTGSAGTGGFPGGTHVGLGSSNSMLGLFCEGGIWPIAFSGGQQSLMFSNMNSASGYNGGL